MNERIENLAQDCFEYFEGTLDGDIVEFDYKKFAELIVRMCADAADMAQDAGCKYAGDYVAEQMGYGEDHGVAKWRSQ